MPEAITRLVGVHGALMVGGFLGTVIALERAVALARMWPYAAPLLSGLAALALIAGAPQSWAVVLFCLAAMVMALACAGVWLRQPVAHHAVLTIAALLWLAGNLVWGIGGTIAPAVPLWSAFLLLTIAAERLELSRFMPTPPIARVLFAIIVAVLLTGHSLPSHLMLPASEFLPPPCWRWRCGCCVTTSFATPSRPPG